jgi:organic radical activating enzyme
MKKYHYADVVLEVTRRCNMKCAHCLRGCAQNVDMSQDIVDTFLDSVESIGSLVFTGGEPVINAELIIHIIDRIIDENIPLEYFYMVTNAGVFNEELYHKMIELYAYVENKYLSNVFVSFDKYHDQSEEIDKFSARWKSLEFYGDAFERIDDNNFSDNLISDGMAKENNIGTVNYHYNDMKVENNHVWSKFYLNAKGYILSDYNMSYKTQAENSLGSIFLLNAVIDSQRKSRVA